MTTINRSARVGVISDQTGALSSAGGLAGVSAAGAPDAHRLGTAF